MNTQSQQTKVCFLFFVMWLYSLPMFYSVAAQPKEKKIPELLILGRSQLLYSNLQARQKSEMLS